MANAHRFAPASSDEDCVFGACSPGWHSAGDYDTAIGQWISFMQDHEIDRVCCLLSGRHLDAADANLGRYRRAFGDDRVHHDPIPDEQLTDPDTLRDGVLPFLEEARRQDERVVVHCLSGIGRTGQVLAAWLVWGRRFDPLTAIETVRNQGRDPAEAIRQGNATGRELFDLLEDLG